MLMSIRDPIRKVPNINANDANNPRTIKSNGASYRLNITPFPTILFLLLKSARFEIAERHRRRCDGCMRNGPIRKSWHKSRHPLPCTNFRIYMPRLHTAWALMNRTLLYLWRCQVINTHWHLSMLHDFSGGSECQLLYAAGASLYWRPCRPMSC
jgi:hypothetical protein